MGADPSAIISSDNHIDNNLMPIHIACMSNVPKLISKLIPITDVSVIKNLLKYSPDKSCVFRICHENLPESIESLESLLSLLKADDFVTYFGDGLPIDYPSDGSENDVNFDSHIPAFWYIEHHKDIFPYIGETPLTHYLRNDWQWVTNSKENGSHQALRVVKRYIKNGSSCNQFRVENSEQYTLPPLSALCCVRKQFNVTSNIANSLEKIIEYLVEQGAKIPKQALTFISLSAHPIVFKTLCDHGAIMVEDIYVATLLFWLNHYLYPPNVLLDTVNHSVPLFYFFHFFGCRTILNNCNYEAVYPFLEKLFSKYKIYDQKLDQSNAALITEVNLLKLCRVVIRNKIRLHNNLHNQNINNIILQLPGLPLDLYDFLCLKSIRIRKIK